MADYRGVVKWFDAKKGYGFIVHPNGGSDIFVHYSQIDSDRRFRTLRTGETVEFDLEDGPKGLHAHNVVAVPDAQEMRVYRAPNADPAFVGNGEHIDWDEER